MRKRRKLRIITMISLSLFEKKKEEKTTAGLIFHPFYIPRISQWLGSQRHPTSHFINISLPDLSLQSTSFFPSLVSFLPSIFFSAGSPITINPSVWLHYLCPPLPSLLLFQAFPRPSSLTSAAFYLFAPWG